MLSGLARRVLFAVKTKEASTEDTTMATPYTMELLDVVQAVSKCTASEEKDVATVADLINSFGALFCHSA